MEKSERPKASRHEHGVDFISNMPDAILLSILSRLPSTEEVSRTSVLSRRWRYVWTSVPSIDIRYRRYGGNLTVNDFKDFVYWVLLNNSVDLDRFHLRCLDNSSILTVERWIHAAVARNVKQIDLMFCREGIGDIKMPHCLVTCGSLEVLRLDGHGLRLPNITGFPALRVLNLTYVKLLNDVNSVNKILESCRLLEDLTLSVCLIEELDHLCISCPNLEKMQICTIYSNPHDRCDYIKISCPKLVDLKLRDLTAFNYIFESLDSLKKAIIEPNWMSNTKLVLFPGICHVESLLINFYFFCQCINAASDPSLPNLKTLMISTTIHGFNFVKFSQILKHYPKLESLKLIITQDFSEQEPEEDDASDLEKVELLEFNGEKPKLVVDWPEVTSLEMEYSWGG